MGRFLIVPVGGVDHGILAEIASALKEVFKRDSDIEDAVPVPEDAYDPKRRQYHSTLVLEHLKAPTKEGYERLLGVTEEDLYVPELNFVFGEADPSSGASVISLRRLRQEFYGLRPDQGLFTLRAIKEAIHEIGHTYGLGHCPDPRCIMHFSNSLMDTDIKGPGLCPVCVRRLRLS